MIYLYLGLLGYLSGSIRFAYLLPLWFKKIDITELSEDGNPGAYNAFKYAGVPIGILVIILELAKGFIPLRLAYMFLDPNDIRFALVIIAPILGHSYPLGNFLKGGKAIAVTFGVFLGLYPELTPLTYLVVMYLLTSLVIVINPHWVRSVICFFLVALGIYLSPILISIKAGCIGGCCLVCFRHILARDKVALPLTKQIKVSFFGGK